MDINIIYHYFLHFLYKANVIRSPTFEKSLIISKCVLTSPQPRFHVPSHPIASIRWQGWPSGESTCLPPMWPGFDFRTRCHMWIEFVGSLLCYERFSPGYSGFPLSSKTSI